ncbi:MAG: hypothetical protein QXG18_02615 [Candidatus Pacearchaeota archaeon]
MIEHLFFIKKYIFLLSFLNIFFGGLVFISLLTFLLGDNLNNILIILLFGTFGFCFFESLVFFIGRLSKKISFGRNKEKYLKKIYKKFELYPLISIFFIKLTYGFSSIFFLFIGRMKKDYKKFFILDFVVNFILVSCFVILGLISRKGKNILDNLINNKNLSLLIIFIILLIIFLLEKIIVKKVMINITKKI